MGKRPRTRLHCHQTQRQRPGMRKPKLYKNEADISLAARSFAESCIVLTCDRKPGLLRDEYRQGGNVVYVNDFPASGFSCALTSTRRLRRLRRPAVRASRSSTSGLESPTRRSGCRSERSQSRNPSEGRDAWLGPRGRTVTADRRRAADPSRQCPRIGGRRKAVTARAPTGAGDLDRPSRGRGTENPNPARRGPVSAEESEGT